MSEVDVAKLEETIMATIRAVGENFRYGKKAFNAEWTLKLKLELASAAGKLGHRVCDSAASHEWLYDQVWIEEEQGEDQQRRPILDVPVVIESEWSYEGVISDFQKLLLARAHLRVMVFEGHTHAKTRKKIDEMISHIRKFRGTTAGDRYLFASWESKGPRDKVKFHFECFPPTPSTNRD